MNEFLIHLRELPYEPTIWALAFLTFLTGIVRGFSGFGTGMMLMSAGTALIGPTKTLLLIWMIDSVPSLPIVLPAFKKAEKKLVLGLSIAAFITIGLGVYALTILDPLPVRWMISIVAILMVVCLWSGWRYRGEIKAKGIAAVGGLSGFLYGLAALPGPPVILYMMGSERPAWLIRANLLAYLFLVEIGLGVSLFWHGLFSAEALAIGVLMSPVFIVGSLVGMKMFGLASEDVFRKAAYILIVASALTSLPLFDSLLRG